MPLNARPAHLPEIIYDKIQTDISSEDVRNSLLDECSAAGPGGVVLVFEGHCKANALRGTDVPLSPGEILGHVKAEKRMAAHVASVLAMDPAEVESLFQGLAGELTQVEKDLADIWFEGQIVNGPGQDIAIALGTAWLFRPSTATSDPFDCDRECLPWNLGLPFCANVPGRSPATNVPCIGLRVPSSAIANPKLPTIFDAGWEGSLYYWYPGGKTMPHPHGPATCSAPLDEIVADAPRLGEVIPHIVRFKSKPL
ncbi:hypothetical protein [Bradyrhizobium yuanmingense]|uniref:hypothetical protein n=1 Tax=Bradyrhizobium yuanmingense TaxID=108015 RepID=UPI003513E381